MSKLLTTADVARILGVSGSYVKNLARRGLLLHQLLPGTTHRRFSPCQVREFMQRMGLPQLSALERQTYRRHSEFRIPPD